MKLVKKLSNKVSNYKQSYSTKLNKKPNNQVSDYKQSYTMKLYQADIILALDHNSKVEVLKSRYGYTKQELTLEETIDMITIFLSRKVFGNNLDMFREGLKIELTKAINQTIKGGVVKCEPHSTNELLEWVSNA